MSDRFEQTIKDWYDSSRTANLEFSYIPENHNPKPSDIYNNVSCIYDKLFLFAKISIKNFHLVIQHLEKLEHRLEKCEENIRKTQSETIKSLRQISSEIHETKPLTKKEVLVLVKEISQQPKFVEEQALKLSEDLNQKIQRIEVLLKEVKTTIG